MNNYTREDILRMVEEEDVGVYPAAVYGYFRNHEKCGDYYKPAGKSTE